MRTARRLALVVFSLAFSACVTLGPIWAPRFQGRVVDARSGTPVAGAVVEATYTMRLIGIEPITGEVDVEVTSTDAEGRFAVGGHPSFAFGILGQTEARPRLTVFHPEYGSHHFDLGSREGTELQRYALHFEIAPNARQLDSLRDVQGSSWRCPGGLVGEGCAQACALAFGSEDCRRR